MVVPISFRHCHLVFGLGYSRCILLMQDVVVHAFNLSHSGGRGRTVNSRPAWAKLV
jgi:hypothetical protein